jgi:hypothetical protein
LPATRTTPAHPFQESFMPQLTTADITTDHESYARSRPELRSRLIPLRAQRRVRVGDLITVEFENLDTLRYQVQEMVYVERLSSDAEVAHEVDAYSRMLPTSHELSATLFIELSSSANAKDELARLDGLQNAVTLEIGDQAVRAVELPGLDEVEDAAGGPLATVSVHMLRFPLDDATRDAFRDPEVAVELAVDHPAYSASTPITGETRRSLIADLTLDR